MAGIHKGFLPFAKKTTSDFFIPYQVGWFTVYNAGDTDVQIILGIDETTDQSASDYLQTLPSQSDTMAMTINGKTKLGVLVHIGPGMTYEKPREWPVVPFGKVITGGNLVYFNSVK